MRDDLVKRLRDLAFHYYLGRSVIEEAADRIEQLTGEVQRWQGMFDEKHNLMLEHKARAKTAEAENARLREAGEKAICHITGYGEASTARIELRAALKGETP